MVNRYGGDVVVIHLPKIGIKENTYFPFSDLNNIQIANLISQFLEQKIHSNSLLFMSRTHYL